jgi:hypothetical protein
MKTGTIKVRYARPGPRQRQPVAVSPEQVLLKRLKSIAAQGQMTLKSLRIEHQISPLIVTELAAKFPDQISIVGTGKEHRVIIRTRPYPAAVVREQPQVDAPPEVDEPPPDEPEEGDPNDALKLATLPAPPAGPRRNYASSDELDRIIAACGGPFRGAALTTGGRGTRRQAGRGRTGRERRPIIDLETGVPA